MRVAIKKCRIADDDARDVEAGRSCRCVSGGGVGRRGIGGHQVVPVGRARGIDREIDARRLQAGRADGDFLAHYQRQEAHAEPRTLEAQERLVAEALGIAEPGGADLDREPRKHADRQVPFNRQLAAGGALDPGLDRVAVVVGIDEQQDGRRAQYEQQHDAGNRQQQGFQEASHRIPAVPG
ncbi:MAG: hypothetical protein U5K76_14885 [Woeseiaceae bacterium]|nr:hypothetical protein [Woeseiaceae bacterium]